ncbi:MAG: helix-turn-helix domain-containing protein [Lachnospiraceae bacterium]|nr:helix-turn-helix domain-containing protein [Lachnospiraceae bacterium]MDD7176360.1 helix-turn-helix domain-containing protein [bacterium]MDY5517634.1 helix-turn-helix domain-containing protein [Lachnospiraceae bacterium]
MITLEEALKKIEKLEKENAYLREELESARNRKMSGRKKHNDKWMNAYNDFVTCFENGMSIVDIAKKQNVSSRTIYRYKEYYDKLQEML